MAKHFRTLLLLGVTGALAASLGCVVEQPRSGAPYGGGPYGGGGGAGGSCTSYQFIGVNWFMDNGLGTPRVACAATPPTAVELTMGSAIQYLIAGTCDDTATYNWTGRTAADAVVTAGDYVTRFRLLRSDTGDELSPGDVFTSANAANPAVPACAGLVLSYQFPLM